MFMVDLPFFVSADWLEIGHLLKEYSQALLTSACLCVYQCLLDSLYIHYLIVARGKKTVDVFMFIILLRKNLSSSIAVQTVNKKMKPAFYLFFDFYIVL